MKIQINENEIYEIQIPEEVNEKELLELLTSLDNIIKLMRISIVKKEIKPKLDEDGNPIKKKYRQSKRRNWCDTKEKCLDIMQYAYHGTREDKLRIQKVTGETWETICKSFHSFKFRWGIQPQDVGLNHWSTRFNRNPTNYKIPNWIIKSYTGIFDENGNK